MKNDVQAMGYVAYFAGQSLGNNPFCCSDPLWTDWDTGWKSARKSLINDW